MRKQRRVSLSPPIFVSVIDGTRFRNSLLQVPSHWHRLTRMIL